MTPRTYVVRLLPLALMMLLTGCGGMLGRGVGGPGAMLTGERATQEIARLEILASDDFAEPYWPFRIAEIRAGIGDGPGADASLDDALQRDPTHAPSLSLRSKRWFQTGRHDDAIALLEAARRTGASVDVALTVGLALHYEAVGRVDDADAIVAAVLEVGGDWRTNGAALTYLRLRGSDFAAARDVAHRAVRASDSAVNLNNYGVALLYAGEPREARKHFERAAKKDPELPGPHYNLAIVDHFYFFDTVGARSAFARYRELADDDPDDLEASLARGPADVAANLGEQR